MRDELKFYIPPIQHGEDYTETNEATLWEVHEEAAAEVSKLVIEVIREKYINKKVTVVEGNDFCAVPHFIVEERMVNIKCCLSTHKLLLELVENLNLPCRLCLEEWKPETDILIRPWDKYSKEDIERMYEELLDKYMPTICFPAEWLFQNVFTMTRLCEKLENDKEKGMQKVRIKGDHKIIGEWNSINYHPPSSEAWDRGYFSIYCLNYYRFMNEKIHQLRLLANSTTTPVRVSISCAHNLSIVIPNMDERRISDIHIEYINTLEKTHHTLYTFEEPNRNISNTWVVKSMLEELGEEGHEVMWILRFAGEPFAPKNIQDEKVFLRRWSCEKRGVYLHLNLLNPPFEKMEEVAEILLSLSREIWISVRLEMSNGEPDYIIDFSPNDSRSPWEIAIDFNRKQDDRSQRITNRYTWEVAEANQLLLKDFGKIESIWEDDILGLISWFQYFLSLEKPFPDTFFQVFDKFGLSLTDKEWALLNREILSLWKEDSARIILWRFMNEWISELNAKWKFLSAVKERFPWSSPAKIDESFSLSMLAMHRVSKRTKNLIGGWCEKFQYEG